MTTHDVILNDACSRTIIRATIHNYYCLYSLYDFKLAVALMRFRNRCACVSEHFFCACAYMLCGISLREYVVVHPVKSVSIPQPTLNRTDCSFPIRTAFNITIKKYNSELLHINFKGRKVLKNVEDHGLNL